MRTPTSTAAEKDAAGSRREPCVLLLLQKRLERRLDRLTAAVWVLCVALAAGYAGLIYVAAVAAGKW